MVPDPEADEARAVVAVPAGAFGDGSFGADLQHGTARGRARKALRLFESDGGADCSIGREDLQALRAFAGRTGWDLGIRASSAHQRELAVRAFREPLRPGDKLRRSGGQHAARGVVATAYEGTEPPHDGPGDGVGEDAAVGIPPAHRVRRLRREETALLVDSGNTDLLRKWHGRRDFVERAAEVP